MRILGALAGGAHGGAETFYTRLMIALHESGIQTHAILRLFDARIEQFKEKNLPYTAAPFGGLFDFQTKRIFKEQIKKIDPQIVLTFMNRATVKCPRSKNDNFVQLARLGGYYNLKYYKKADYLIALTHDIYDYIIQNGWPKEKVHYLPNFAVQIPGTPINRQDLDTPDDVPLLVTLARLHDAKAIDVLLHAMTQVKDAYLWIAGEGPLRQELESLMNSLGLQNRVRFLGWRQDIPDLIATSDMVVFPSRYEPHGTVVLEAWMHERPLIAAASKGPAGLVNDGENGLLVPINDADSLAKAIQKVLNSSELAANLVIQGKETYTKHHSQKAVLSQYTEFFQKVVQKTS
ncbi:MAG: glycosyltransferase [Alphaproteobacteria bacterium]|nr:glycosyltransferase [Alphaproteobacteria bacterium]